MDDTNEFLPKIIFFLETLSKYSSVSFDDESEGKFKNILITTKGPDKLYRKIPWDFLRRKTPKYRGMCRYYFSVPHP